MIYLDNIIFSLQRAGGISVVWQNLVCSLLAEQTQFRVLEHPSALKNIQRKNIAIPQELIEYCCFNKIVSQVIRPKVSFPHRFVFHSSYFRTCNNPNAINITTVHDFIYDQGKPTLKQKLRIKINNEAIKKSDIIVCISENTKKDLFKLMPEIDPRKVQVIYNGVSDEYSPLINRDLPDYHNYIMFVGGRNGYKNFDFAVKSLSVSNFQLLICGAPLTRKEISLLDQYLPNRYRNIIYPSNQELNVFYNSVNALLYPSSYEGFGLPILEAQKAGCPVIALNASSIPEIIGETPLLLDRLEVGILNKKLSLLSSDSLRNEIIEAGIKNSSRFSWKKMGNEYLELYNSLLK